MKRQKGRETCGDFLEPIKSKKKRKSFIVYDIESKADDTQEAGFTRPFLVGMLDPNEVKKGDDGYQEFRDEPHLKSYEWSKRHLAPGGCIDKFLHAFLCKKYSGYFCYAHNGGNFDHLFLLAWLQERQDEYGFEIIPVQSSILSMKVWRKPEEADEPIRERWEFLDSMKLLPMGLDKACKTFKLPIGKLAQDLNAHEDDPSWSIYLKQDCLALANVMAKAYDMIENRLQGEVGITTPSTSMKLFRRRFMGKGGCPPKIPRWKHWPHCKDKNSGACACEGCMHQWILSGYYGGRTEIHRLAGERLHYYDINSSYVNAMRYEMPIGDRIVEFGKLNWQRRGEFTGFCECTVYIPPDCKIPPLPHRDKVTGKLIFPTGQFHGVWNTEELDLLSDPLVKGEVRHVVKTVWFELRPMLGEMVTELWKLRDPKLPGYDEGLSALAKLLGNGAYGKFAMSRERTSIVFEKEVSTDRCFICGDPHGLEDNGKKRLCAAHEGSKAAMPDEKGTVWYQANKVDASYIIPQIPAYITTLARINLWKYMKMGINLGGEVFYLDTDSLIIDVVLPTSTMLGELKDEYPGELLRFSAVQPKVYLIEKMGSAYSKVTMKGFPQKERTKPNLERLKAGESISWKQLEKVRTLARLGFRRSPLMKQIHKSFKSSYDKRVVLPDGGTRAVVLNEPVGGYVEEIDAAAE